MAVLAGAIDYLTLCFLISRGGVWITGLMLVYFSQLNSQTVHSSNGKQVK
jgi:hypothetical protein